MAAICSCLTGKSTRTLIWESLKCWGNYLWLQWLLSVLVWMEILQRHCLRKSEVLNHYLHDISIKAVTLVAVAVICSCLTKKFARTLSSESLKCWGNYLHTISIIAVFLVAVAVICSCVTGNFARTLFKKV